MGRRTGRRPRDPDPEAALAEHPERDERRAPGGDDAPLPGEAGRAGRDRGDEKRAGPPRPAEVAALDETPSRANARGRSAGANSTWVIESTCGHMAADPRACTTRAAMSVVGVGAAAHSAEAASTRSSSSRRRPSSS